MTSTAELASIYAAQQEKEKQEGKTLTVGQLKSISELVSVQHQIEQQIAQTEMELKTLKEQLVKIQGTDLIDALDAAGTDRFRTSDGLSVEIRKKYNAKIDEENQDQAFSWLENNGHDGIIKCEVKTLFRKGEFEKAQTLLAALAAKKYKADLTRNVHPSTLRAFVKEMMEDPKKGETFPADTFKASVFRYTKIEKEEV